MTASLRRENLHCTRVIFIFSSSAESRQYSTPCSCGSYIQNGISEFHKGNRLGSHDYMKISLLLSCCDMLGNSWICRELLDISGNFTPPAQHHFMRSLRKIGVYCVGIKKLYDSVTKCTKVKEIDVMVLPSPQDSLVSCHTDWYRFLCDEARVVLQ